MWRPLPLIVPDRTTSYAVIGWDSSHTSAAADVRPHIWIAGCDLDLRIGQISWTPGLAGPLQVEGGRPGETFTLSRSLSACAERSTICAHIRADQSLTSMACNHVPQKHMPGLDPVRSCS